MRTTQATSGHFNTMSLMDPSETAPMGQNPNTCDVVTHLQWTLAVDWRTVLGSKELGGTELVDPALEDRALQPGWKSRATSWRDGREGTDAWVESLDASVTPSWSALQNAHTAAGLNPAFRTGPASYGSRHYGWYQDLEKRMVRKFDVDGQNDVSPMTRAIRGFLDIIHVHPFADGNTRAACTWLVWSLAGAGVNVPDLGPFLELPKPPGDEIALRSMVALLSA